MKKDMKNEDKKGGKIGIVPLGDRVLIRESEEKQSKTSSGIYIPEGADSDKGAKKGKVIAVGEGRYEDGRIVPIRVKEGDTVLFQWGDKIEVGDETYFIVREAELVAIVK